ncbi:hypothetical protein HBI43_050160 [Parastagonospora nodorum]|nr:hypothetical protein HBI43_050160 [Parastagonospora nodorum]
MALTPYGTFAAIWCHLTSRPIPQSQILTRLQNESAKRHIPTLAQDVKFFFPTCLVEGSAPRKAGLTRLACWMGRWWCE